MEPKFLPTNEVTLKTDVEKLNRIVTGYKVTANDITYEISCGTSVSWHYDYEVLLNESIEKPPAGFGRVDKEDLLF